MSETSVSGLANNCGGTPPSSLNTSVSNNQQNALPTSASSFCGALPSSSETRTIQRPRLTEYELENCSQEELLKTWKELDSYVDNLLVQASNQEAELASLREADERSRAQLAEASSRERALLRRLTAKEQEVQDYAVQVQELKNSTAPGPAALRAALLDPAVNLLIKKLRNELLLTRTRLEETQNELSAWKFTPDSNTGKRLMAKCRMLYQENEELGRIVASGRMAKLEGELALQKTFSQEVKKSQSELDEFLQELDEDVEGMQSTIYYLQQELRKSRATVTSLEQEVSKLRNSGQTSSTTSTTSTTLPTPPESERTLSERQEEVKEGALKEDGVERTDSDEEGIGITDGVTDGVDDETERTEGQDSDTRDGLVGSRHRDDDRRNNSSMNNNNGEDVSAMLGKRTSVDDSDDSDDVPLSKKLRPNSCAQDERDVVERDRDPPPLMNGKNDDKQP